MARGWKMRQIDPTVDCVFKKILGSAEHKVLTLDFLNAMLGAAGSAKLDDLIFMDPHLHKHFMQDKRPVVDILITGSEGNLVQIEVQAFVTSDLENRSVFDWSKLHASSLGEGDSYHQMKGAISIWILTANLFPEEVTQEVFLKFRITCPEAGLELKRDSYILVVQLKNWKGHGTLDPAVERWLMLFREGKNFDLNHPPKCLDDEVMRMALDVMKNFAKDKLEYLRYEKELKRRRLNEWQDAFFQRRLKEETQAKERERRAKEKERRAKEKERRAKEKERRAKEKERRAKEKERLAKEQERRAKEQERQAKEQERLAKEQAEMRLAAERLEKEALFAELVRLRETLATRGDA